MELGLCGDRIYLIETDEQFSTEAAYLVPHFPQHSFAAPAHSVAVQLSLPQQEAQEQDEKAKAPADTRMMNNVFMT